MSSSAPTVVITGASGNLGRAVADAFAARGANLVLIASRRESLASAFGGEDAKRLFAPADLRERGQVDAAVRAAVARFGRIDVLCNIAGGFRMGTAMHETTDADWDFLIDIIVRTLLNMVRAIVPLMLAAGAGRIIYVGAHAAL
jgi:NADP-dependent 3-hydroxy acid dehydrogenase YdfG